MSNIYLFSGEFLINYLMGNYSGLCKRTEGHLRLLIYLMKLISTDGYNCLGNIHFRSLGWQVLCWEAPNLHGRLVWLISVYYALSTGRKTMVAHFVIFWFSGLSQAWSTCLTQKPWVHYSLVKCGKVPPTSCKVPLSPRTGVTALRHSG